MTKNVRMTSNKPTIMVSTATDPAVRAGRNMINLEKWKIQYKHRQLKEEKFKDDWVRAFSLI